MNITVQRKRRGGVRTTYTSTAIYDVLEMIRKGTYGAEVERFRACWTSSHGESEYARYDRLPKVNWAMRYRKTAQGELQFGEYSGVVALKIDGLLGKAQMDEVKRGAMLLPQTLAAFASANGRGVTILALASLPDGTQPKEEALAQLFHAKAYRTAVMCYAPTAGPSITIEYPAVDALHLISYDPDMLMNTHAIPFFLEQPDSKEVEELSDARLPKNELNAVPTTSTSMVSMHQAFNACFNRARNTSTKEQWLGQPMMAVVRTARECADCGLPEEEVTQHLLWRYAKADAQDVRTSVRSVYREYAELPHLSVGMPKKQLANLQLKEFLGRRYQLRYNEVLQMMEYRIRRSIDFRFHELGKFDRNTIRYEAACEGIEAFDSEVNGLIDSNYTPRFNPIDSYLNGLAKWDGTPRIEALAQLVPNQNPHWPRLFRRWFLSMVAHWMGVDKTHSNNTAPILVGPQAYRKSTFCRILLPPELRGFFTDSLDLRTKQEAERALTRFLLINIDEFDQLSESQFAYVKHLFQKPEVSMRRMYSATIAQQRRYTSFIGTSNQEEILRDPTGNRRYLCVRVTAPIRVETPIDYQQLYAEAVTVVREGKEPYWFGDEEEALVRESNRSFEVQTPEEQIFRDLFEVVPEEAEGGEWMRLTGILTIMADHRLFNRKTMNNLAKLGRIVTHFDLPHKHCSDGSYYWVKRK